MKIKIRSRICMVIFITAYSGNLFAQDSSDALLYKEKHAFENLEGIVRANHYAPPLLDDSFSVKIFDAFLRKLDLNKNIFLQKDIDFLLKYKYQIDEDIKGDNPLTFYRSVESIYLKRLQELSHLSLLENTKKWKPIHKKEKLLEEENLSWSKTNEERINRWEQLFTFQYLSKYLDLDKGYNSTQERNHKAIASVAQKYRHWFGKNTTEFDEANFFSQYMNVYCSILDPHTDYLPPAVKRKFDQQMSNAFYGIGVQLALNDQGDIVIKSEMQGMAAWKSGKITEGSTVLALSSMDSGKWVSTDGLDIQEIIDKIRGAENTYIGLQLKDATTGNIQSVTLKREKVNLLQSAARSAIIEQEDGKRIGILYLPEFYNDFAHQDGAKSAKDVAAELINLNKRHINALMVDLRNNGGGSLGDVVKIAGYFIPSGPIVQVRDRLGNVGVYNDYDTSVLYNGPLAVLINGQTASASEIFAAAMQDYKRGVVIGTNSYGKGTVQRQIPLGTFEKGDAQFGDIKLTIEKFYRVNGATTQKIGVTPDFFIPDMYNCFHVREKDHFSALKSDSVSSVPFKTYFGEVQNKLLLVNRFVYRRDTSLEKMDKLSEQIANPIERWTDLTTIKAQYNAKKDRVDKYKKIETINQASAMKFIPVGKHQNEDWYKEWINSLRFSRIILHAKSIVMQGGLGHSQMFNLITISKTINSTLIEEI